MRLRTYRAHTMGDALAQVKKDLGKDAVILHTRSFKVGGWFGFGGKPVYEITASDTVNVMPKGSARAAAASCPERTSGATAIVDNSPAAESSTAVPPSATEKRAAVPQTVAAAAALRAYGNGRSPPAAPVRPRPTAVPQALSPESVPPRTSSAQAVLAPALDEELAVIKRLVGQVLQTTRSAAVRSAASGANGSTTGAAATMTPGLLPEPLVEHYLRLLEAEVAAEIADEIVTAVRDELTTAELSDAAIVHQTVLRHLASLIPADADVARPGQSSDNRPLTIALVGPTGVGKTTTVAKLAAAYKLRHGKRVGLVTTDTYRIAAVDQLRTYAEIIGLPLKVAMSPTEMGTVCESLGDCDVILIDTAGRSQRDSGRLEELRQFIEAAQPHQTHLVLSSTASESVLVEAAQRFAQVNPNRVIFTKVDEAVNFGVLVTVAKRLGAVEGDGGGLKLSYVTTGQEVPDHIEVGRPERIARLLLDGREVR